MNCVSKKGYMYVIRTETKIPLGVHGRWVIGAKLKSVAKEIFKSKAHIRKVVWEGWMKETTMLNLNWR